ncbi:thiaminase II [Salisediminibacterium halotolerans]|uniref:thiaminase II n=1 Tax=Salisediminibacterium halotolerans TaxID=517425 RepID=UPI000EB3A000|nr:thiaminase II [Salisediminibacterium halotolerans]RLJ71711.1 thiaminase/transcriptional activator TenA [Actinophytocola xinjiangensis]RPE86861.1 thiaminase/transcriptional activator TenA [Salisediminibacterium halotolerans]TWG32924.1 thiaminase/transcriptional activator TenA [Salisediminibacterium halotolerans]GEL07778.1 aminopyrimidine aminohydrolase [Salisediminibacterium halotolerans]
MTEMFTDRLYRKAAPIWDAYLEHPFVKGIGEGWLTEEKFKHFMKQDYLYLIEYSRIMALGAAKAPDLTTMSMFANLLHETLETEMQLHREYAGRFGITEDELEAEEPAAVTTAYTSYMLNVSQIGGAENVIASVLACAWSYNHIGKILAGWPGALKHPLYGTWVEMYASDEFTKLAEDCKTLMNQAAEGRTERELKTLEDIVVKTSRFEYMFWDMAEHLETWPTEKFERER